MKRGTQRFFLLALLTTLSLLLSGCAALRPGPKTISVSEAQLAELLARQFPFNNRYLEIFDVVLSAPQLRLLPESNRLATNLSYSIGGPVLGVRKFTGNINLSYGLRFEPSDQTVRLSGVRVEQFQVPGVPAMFQNQANRLGAVLAENLLHDFPLHRLKDEDLKAAQGWGYKPGAFRVVPGGLQLQLDPIERR